MFSIIFFAFIVLILIGGFIGIKWRKNHKTTSTVTEDFQGVQPVQRSNSAFNETPTGNIKGGILPADNKLPSNDFTDENEAIK